jgi:GH25 family lysozyme M1 (1,4-beta-N-acetylmuramidase)
MKKIYTFFLLIISVPFYAQQPQGVDVSHHQGSIDWSLVYADGKVFAFVKATEGYTYNDPQFVTNMQNGTNAGVLMGAYHFARPDNNSAADEANHFVNVAGNYIGNGYLPPVLDLEDPPGTDLQNLYSSQQLTNWVRTWLQTVENLTGVRPMIYTNGRYTNYLDPSLNSYYLWIAEPDGNTNPPDNLGHWTDWKFKQFSWTGNVSGINGDVDLNVFNGTLAQLDSLAQGGGGGNTVSLDCSQAVALDCGDLYHGPASSDTSRVYSYGCNGWTETGPERVHTLTPTQNGNIQVVISGFTGDLDVYILDDCDPAQCSGTVYSSSAVLTGAQAGHTYYLVVDADDGSGSKYDIFAGCTPSGIPDDISLNNALVTSGDTVDAGNQINVYVKQYYAGTSANMPSVEVGYYLSTDCQWDNNDILLGSDISQIDANTRTEIEYNTLTIPSGTHHGQYYVLFVADRNNAVNESSEENNTVCIPLYVNNTVSVDKILAENDIHIYPNPVRDKLFWRSRNTVEIARSEIFDLTGKRIYTLENPQENSIDVSRLSKGVYLLRITDRLGRTGTFRFIKD